MACKKLFLLSIFLLIIISISAVGATEDTVNSTAPLDNSSQAQDNGLKTNGSLSSDLKYISSSDVKSVNLKASKLSTTYGSGKYFNVKAIDNETKKPVSNLKINLKIYTGKKSKKISIKTNSKGIAKYSASTLSVGKHKVNVKLKGTKIKYNEKRTYIRISKATLTVSAPKTTNYLKENEKFKVTVKNKESKKVMKNINVKIKVFTGKKFKTYSLKTNKYGIVSFNTKSLGKGTHKVIVNIKSSAKVNPATRKSSIKIVKKPQYINLKVNGHRFKVRLENNKATSALIEKLKKGNITVAAEEYDNFEKVGNLGFSLPRSDKYISTSPGDIVLYDGNKISLFYNTNSWEYTKLGRLVDVDANDLRNILGSGDVTFVLSLK